MNGGSNGGPSSGLVLEFCYDSSTNNDVQLEDRTFTWVTAPPQTDTALEGEDIIEVYVASNRRNTKPLPLQPGCAEVFIDASLPAPPKLSVKKPSAQRRPENRQLKDCDIVEIPAEASQEEIDAILKNRPRSRKAGQTNDVSNGEEVKMFIKIGRKYQAAVHSRLADEERTPTVSVTDQIWDPWKAAELPERKLGKHRFCLEIHLHHEFIHRLPVLLLFVS